MAASPSLAEVLHKCIMHEDLNPVQIILSGALSGVKFSGAPFQGIDDFEGCFHGSTINTVSQDGSGHEQHATVTALLRRYNAPSEVYRNSPHHIILDLKGNPSLQELSNKLKVGCVRTRKDLKHMEANTQHVLPGDDTLSADVRILYSTGTCCRTGRLH